MDGINRAAARAHAVTRRWASPKPKGVDPTTSDIDYSADEVEYMLALDAYRARTGRKFLTACEQLAVLRELGYRKFAAPDDDEEPPCAASPTG